MVINTIFLVLGHLHTSDSLTKNRISLDITRPSLAPSLPQTMMINAFRTSLSSAKNPFKA
ncbi:hypothetical protein KGM_200368 [Danaus plexippus plexippus]|uniref:Uncharacterized protein n=1 Tax=Danaus plexippus plexippus TaxID=278856 RepID=A0A212EMK2_DANPL|nr:hypothetical protein KGM_200368 [Danaus plexippus plexippus]